VQTGFAWLPALVGAAVGLPVGWLLRLLLAAVPRGAVLRCGPIEIATAVVTGAGMGLSWPSADVALLTWAGFLGVGLGAVDLVHHRLPDSLTLPAIPISAAVVVGTEFLAPGTGNLLVAICCAMAATGLFWALAALAPRAMGLGDVKLIPSLALLTGYLSVATTVIAVLLAFVLGAVVALVGMLLRRLTLTSAIAFGPFLLAGCWLVLAIPGLTSAIIG
jgi:leader peptidase (prepilin peptidase)/N-methyltransferase